MTPERAAVIVVSVKHMANEQKSEEKKNLDPKNRQLSYAEHQALRAKQAEKAKGFTLPLFAKIILTLPLIAVFLFGLIFIPLMAIRGCNSSPETTQGQ